MKSGFLFLLVVFILYCGNIAFSQTEVFDESYKDHPLIRKADSLRLSENWDLSIAAYTKAEITAKEEENWAGYVYTINQAGYCYRRKREYSESRQMFDRALREGTELLGDNHPEIANTYYQLGYYYYFRKNRDNDSSLWARKKSVEINEKSSPVSMKDLASSYHAMASLLNEGYKNYFEAITWYEKALNIRSDFLSSNDTDLGATYSFLGLTYHNLNDDLRAQIYINSAIEIFESNPQSTVTQKYRAYNNVALANTALNEHYLAISNLTKSIKIVSAQYGENHWQQINRYNNLGNGYANIEELDSALKYINWSMQINFSYPDEIDTVLLADSYSHLGAIYYSIKQFDSAKYYYNISLPLLEENDFRYIRNNVNLAEIYYNEESFLESKLACQAAIQGLEPNQENLIQDIQNIKDPISYFLPIHFLAKTQLEIYNESKSPEDLKEALNFYYEIERLKDMIRNAAFSNDAKYKISNQFKSSAGEFLSVLALKPENLTDQEISEATFEIMERNRYGELFRNVVNIESSAHLDVPDSLLQLERLLASQISVFNRNLAGSGDNLKPSMLLEYERKYQKVKQALSTAFPSYYESKFGKELIDLQSIQSLLKKNEQILEYFWGDSMITILSITQNSSDLHQTPISESLEKQILGFLSFCSEVPSALALEEELYKDYETGAVGLFEKLVKPLLNSEANQLIVIPDGPISLIPFEALLTKSGNSTFYNAPFMIRDINIRYGYSCNLLFQGNEKNIDKNSSLLAMAYSNGGSPSSDTDRNEKTSIPGSGLELNSIRKIFKQKNNSFLFDKEATESAFKEKASDFEIIHLAVHGTGDTTDAFKSHLIFPDASGITEDGRLYAHELYAIDFQKLILVVLSACQTGIGKEYPGEGIFSMARGFRYSGATTTVMSLWDVEDNSTANIMESFYQSLSSGKPVSESLRKAKIDFIGTRDSRFSHPAYWAAFVSIGQDTVMKRSRNTEIFVVISVLMVAILFGYLIIKKGYSAFGRGRTS